MRGLPIRPLLFGLLGLACSLTASAEFAVIVHPDNPVQTMTPRQVSDLYLGRARSFSAAEPQATGPASVYEHPADSPLREAFFRVLNGMSIKQLNAYWARLRFSGEVLPPAALADSRAVVDAVSRNRHAIGYVEAAAAGGQVKVVLRLNQ